MASCSIAGSSTPGSTVRTVRAAGVDMFAAAGV
jgi:hypothetical protein